MLPKRLLILRLPVSNGKRYFFSQGNGDVVNSRGATEGRFNWSPDHQRALVSGRSEPDRPDVGSVVDRNACFSDTSERNLGDEA